MCFCAYMYQCIGSEEWSVYTGDGQDFSDCFMLAKSQSFCVLLKLVSWDNKFKSLEYLHLDCKLYVINC